MSDDDPSPLVGHLAIAPDSLAELNSIARRMEVAAARVDASMAQLTADLEAAAQMFEGITVEFVEDDDEGTEPEDDSGPVLN